MVRYPLKGMTKSGQSAALLAPEFHFSVLRRLRETFQQDLGAITIIKSLTTISTFMRTAILGYICMTNRLQWFPFD